MNKTLWVMVGAPGSGKTWVAKNILMREPGWKYISRDEVRFSIITDEDKYFEKENIVFAEFIHRIQDALNEDGIMNVIADATHLNWASRRKLLNALGKTTGEDVVPVVIENEIDEILFNNDERIGRSRVPRSVIRRMKIQTTDPKDDPIKYKDIMRITNHRKEYDKCDLDNV